jgi:hypothetical protein
MSGQLPSSPQGGAGVPESEAPFLEVKERWVVERGDDFIVIRLPWWTPRSLVGRLVEDALRDARVRYPRLTFSGAAGSRMIRFDWKAC